MALDKKFIGRAYGPYQYEVGAEKLREYAYAVGGAFPALGSGYTGVPDGLHPWLHERAAAADSPYRSLVALPSFAVVFAIAPFGQACIDPELQINLLMLVHGEQELEWLGVIRPGDLMTTTGVITDIYSKAGKDFLVVTTDSKNQRGELVVKGTWTAVIRGA